MLLFGAIAVAGLLTIWATVEVWDWAFNREDEVVNSEPESQMTYYHDNEVLETPQVGIKYLIEDEDGIDADETVEAVAEWIRNDDPNIISGDWQAQVNTLADTGVIQIKGDASPLLLESYEDVELPYVDNNGDLNWVNVDLDFA
jgi:hypothetical protein